MSVRLIFVFVYLEGTNISPPLWFSLPISPSPLAFCHHLFLSSFQLFLSLLQAKLLHLGVRWGWGGYRNGPVIFTQEGGDKQFYTEGVQTFYVRDIGGNDEIDGEEDEAVSKENKLSGRARALKYNKISKGDYRKIGCSTWA